MIGYARSRLPAVSPLPVTVIQAAVFGLSVSPIRLALLLPPRLPPALIAAIRLTSIAAVAQAETLSALPALNDPEDNRILMGTHRRENDGIGQDSSRMGKFDFLVALPIPRKSPSDPGC